MSNKENQNLWAKMQEQRGMKRDGFRNQGQTCYLNATLQLFYHLSLFKSSLLRASKGVSSAPAGQVDEKQMEAYEKSVGVKLAEVFQSKQSKDVVDPVALKRCIGSRLKQFNNNDQEDAHELLYALLDQVYMDFAPFSAPESGLDPPITNPVASNFVWELEQSMKCKECDYESRRSEVFHDLSLDLPSAAEIKNGVVQLRTLLGRFFQEEEVSYKCEKCECEKATLSRRIVKLPRFFLVHIKRYVIDLVALAEGKQAVVRKRAEAVGIDEKLDFARWCVKDAGRPDDVEREEGDTPEQDADDGVVTSLFAGTTKDDRVEEVEGGEAADGADVQLLSDNAPDLSKMTEQEQIDYGELA